MVLLIDAVQQLWMTLSDWWAMAGRTVTHETGRDTNRETSSQLVLHPSTHPPATEVITMATNNHCMDAYIE